MERQQVIENIKKVARQVLPKGSTLYLYGSRARGDYHEDSDWDLLLLLDKAKIEFDDFQRYSYPFVLMGWDMGEASSPQYRGIIFLVEVFSIKYFLPKDII